jgi:branched-chain amino acid transport system permease protein
VAVVVGGLGLVEGSLLGAAFVILVPVLVSESGWLVPVLFGLATIAVLLFEPLGLAGRWLKMRLYFETWPFR